MKKKRSFRRLAAGLVPLLREAAGLPLREAARRTPTREGSGHCRIPTAATDRYWRIQVQ